MVSTNTCRSILLKLCLACTVYLGILILWKGHVLQGPVDHLVPSTSLNFLRNYTRLLTQEQSRKSASPGMSMAVACHLNDKLSTDPSTSADAVLSRLPIFQSFVPSLCRNATGNFNYSVYVMLKTDQAVHREDIVRLFQRICKNSNVNVHIVETPPAVRMTSVAATNILLINHAYLNSYDYYMTSQCNGILTEGWDTDVTSPLMAHDPSGCGAVFLGSRDGNVDGVMVHSTHLDLYNALFPHSSKNESTGQAWIKCLYQEKDLLKTFPAKLSLSRIQDTKCDRRHLYRYIEVQKLKLPPPDGKRIVSVSLYGGSIRYTSGALRNAQLINVHYPGWILRFYVEKPKPNAKPKYGKIPDVITSKLAVLGAELNYVDTETVRVPPMMWRFLAADDMSLDYFIVRDSDSRLTRRDAIVTHEWMKSGKAFHCIRDHPSHSRFAISGGLWGGKPGELRNILNKPLSSIMGGIGSGYLQDMNFLNSRVWPIVSKNSTYCHDSFSCTRYPSSHPFPVLRQADYEHLGEVFDQRDNGRGGDIAILRRAKVNKECVQAKYNISDTDPITF